MTESDLNSSVQVELLVHFESFMNVDLLKRGVYRLGARIEGVSAVTTQQDQVFNFSTVPHSPRHCFYPALLLPSVNWFFTRAFKIRYANERVKLGDALIFKLCLPISQHEDPVVSSLTLFVDMFFCDRPTNPADLELVSTKKFIIHSVTTGISISFNVIFDDLHFSTCLIHLSSALLDVILPKNNAVMLSQSPIYLLEPPFIGRPKDDSSGFGSTFGETSSQNPPMSLREYSDGLIRRSAILLKRQLKHIDSLLKPPEQKRFETEISQLINEPQCDNKGLAPNSLDQHIIVPIFIRKQPKLSRKKSPKSSILPDPSPSTAITSTSESSNTQNIESIDNVKERIGKLWRMIITIFEFCHSSRSYLKLIKMNEKLKMNWIQSVLSEEIKNPTLEKLLSLSTSSNKTQIEVAKSFRSSNHFKSRPSRCFEDCELSLGFDDHPIFFEQRINLSGFVNTTVLAKSDQRKMIIEQFQIQEELYDIVEQAPSVTPNPQKEVPSNSTSNQSEEKRKGKETKESSLNQMLETEDFPTTNSFTILPNTTVHLVICIHGLGGSIWDLRQIKNHLKIVFPNHIFFVCKSIEGDSVSDIREMAGKVTDEIRGFIDNQNATIGKISFIGHSLGSIIIREVLRNPKMHSLHSHCHTFLSLSSPHLGTNFSNSKVIHSAIRLIQKATQSVCLMQLALKDAVNPDDCYLNNLSYSKSFELFKHIILVSSEQDLYSPSYSARLECCQDSESSTVIGRLIKSMASNILLPLIKSQRTIIKIGVVFGKSVMKGIDKKLGRAARL